MCLEIKILFQLKCICMYKKHCVQNIIHNYSCVLKKRDLMYKCINILRKMCFEFQVHLNKDI